jgi:hypothetical protein
MKSKEDDYFEMILGYEKKKIRINDERYERNIWNSSEKIGKLGFLVFL